MADIIDLKIQNAMIHAGGNCNCNWDKPIDVINQMPQTISLWGDTYDKSQYWDQWHWVVVDWKKGYFQILNLPGCNYWIIFMNGKVGCKYTLVVNVIGDQDPNGQPCEGQYFNLAGNISGYNCDKADSCNVLWSYNDGSIKIHETTFLGFTLLESQQSPNSYAYYVISKIGGFDV